MNAFKFFVEKLKTIYDNDEATAISHQIFEHVIGNKKHNNLLWSTDQISSTNHFAKMQHILFRLVSSEPLQHILGEVEFLSCKIKVDKNVLIPRPETEELVFILNKRFKFQKKLNVLDVCSGSGCIAIAIAKSNPTFKVTAVEKSIKAYQLSTQNNILNETNVSIIHADIFSWKSDCQFDIIISNPPYIMQSEYVTMHKNVLNFEPQMALFVENNNPLFFYSEIKRIAIESLKIGGEIFLEINPLVAFETLTLFIDEQFSAELINDMYGKSRFVIAKRIN